jgi:hypothetical protein
LFVKLIMSKTPSRSWRGRTAMSKPCNYSN